MTQLAESLDDFLLRAVRKLIPRLLAIERESSAGDDVSIQVGQGGTPDLLAELRMAVRLRNVVDEHIRVTVVTGGASRAESLLDQVLDAPSSRFTWKELGHALGVSAQAAHRKYGAEARSYDAARKRD